MFIRMATDYHSPLSVLLYLTFSVAKKYHELVTRQLVSTFCCLKLTKNWNFWKVWTLTDQGNLLALLLTVICLLCLAKSLRKIHYYCFNSISMFFIVSFSIDSDYIYVYLCTSVYVHSLGSFITSVTHTLPFLHTTSMHLFLSFFFFLSLFIVRLHNSFSTVNNVSCQKLLVIVSTTSTTTTTTTRTWRSNSSSKSNRRAYSIKLCGSVNYGFIVTAKFWL